MQLVSTIIPTYNRASEVFTAIRSALGQDYGAQEVIVVDDGSTDDTRDRLQAEFGERIRYFYKENGGVSSARNYGMERATGAYLAFLDSDDEWLPGKLTAQVEFLAQRPDYGLALCDVITVDHDRCETGRVHRRNAIPADGDVLRWVLRTPSLAPASALLTRAAYQAVGGFDISLRTAEDLDFHLRVARKFKIGIVEQPLVRCMRGHDGLSSLDRTYRDYLLVVERFLEDAGAEIAAPDQSAALFNAYAQCARGLIWDNELVEAAQFAARAGARVRDRSQARALTRLGSQFARHCASRARRRLLGR